MTADMVVRSHEQYLEQGILVTDSAQLRQNYRKSKMFLVDLLSVFPTDIAFLFFDTSCHEEMPCLGIVRKLKYRKQYFWLI